MSGPFAGYFGNQRTVTIPISPSDYDRATMTAVTSTNLTLLTLGANSIATGRIMFYLHWLTATPNTFPAAVAMGTGFLQVSVLNAALAVILGPLNVKAFSWAQQNNGILVPYTFEPTSPHLLVINNPALIGVAAFLRPIINVTAIVGAPSAVVEAGMSLDTLNSGPAGTIGGADIVAQGANNPNAF